MDDRGGLGDIGDALAAARITLPELREALDGARGMVSAAADTEAEGALWVNPPVARQRLRHLVRIVTRVDFWILIVGIVGVVIAYLTLVKRG